MKNFKPFYNVFQKFLIPPRFVHWKTPLLGSLFLWVGAALTSNQEWRLYLSNLSWLLLIVAIGWRTTEEPFVIRGVSLSPWLTAALICLFCYGNFSRDRQPLAVIIWPILSASIAVILKYIESGKVFLEPPPLIRPIFLIFLFCHALISCWLAFQFLIIRWLEDYPSLLAEDFSRSGFVINTRPQSINNSRGLVMIKLTEGYLKNKTSNRPWPEVELWLLNVGNQRISLTEQALKKLPKLPEDSLWELKTTLVQGESRYQLGLTAQWQGPSSNAEGYSLRKSCEVTKIGTKSKLECSPVKASNRKQTKPEHQGGVKI